MKPRYTYPFDLPDEDAGGAGVYFILNTVSLRMRIGQSGGIYRRMMTHYGQLMCGTHTNRALQEDWNSFGEHAFEFGILVTLPSPFYLTHQESYLRELELHFMRVYQTKNPIYGYDFDQQQRKHIPKNTYEGFFAHTSRDADREIAKILGNGGTE